MKYLLYAILFTLFITFLGCEREELNMDPNARLSFSLDTLSFDTVFTTIGSVTLNFRVYNPYDKDIVVSKVSIKGEMQSPFNINVDGIEGGAQKTIEEVVIRAKDSMYVFVEVKLDANNSNLPLIIKDSIEFITNSNAQYVQLSAYGQDVHHLRVEDAAYFAYLDEAKTIKAIVLKSTDLIGDKPYLVHDHIIVDSTAGRYRLAGRATTSRKQGVSGRNSGEGGRPEK